METVNILESCALSFLAVFILLSILAIVIRLVTTFLPERVAQTDAALIAAIHVAVAAACPEARVTRIEEIKS
jgi:hypothetical protein